MATSDAACSCGQLRLTVGGEPLAITMCHCLACQRRTGSVVSVQAIYRPAQVEIAGRYSEYVRLAEDDDQRRYCFCPDCGATVFFTVPTRADFVGVPVGAFADPSFPPPTISVYESRRHSWVIVPESVTRHV